MRQKIFTISYNVFYTCQETIILVGESAPIWDFKLVICGGLDLIYNVKIVISKESPSGHYEDMPGIPWVIYFVQTKKNIKLIKKFENILISSILPEINCCIPQL